MTPDNRRRLDALATLAPGWYDANTGAIARAAIEDCAGFLDRIGDAHAHPFALYPIPDVVSGLQAEADSADHITGLEFSFYGDGRRTGYYFDIAGTDADDIEVTL